MKRVQKNKIGQSGKFLVQSLLLREGITCSPGENGIDLMASFVRPRREYGILVVTNLQPKRVGGRGKDALDWWIPVQSPADFVACVDLSTLRVWLFTRNEVTRLAQQKLKIKQHLYMYTEKAVALRGRKNMKFDYEFESFRLENRLHRGIFEKR